MGNIKSSIKLDNIVSVIPFIFAIYLGCTYILGFIVSQIPYIKDFGVLPFQQVHYLYNGFLPLLYINMFLLLSILILTVKRQENRLRKPSYWFALILISLFLCLIVICVIFNLKNMYFDLITVFSSISVLCFFIYFVFYYYKDLSDNNATLISLRNEFEELKKQYTQIHETALDEIGRLKRKALAIGLEALSERESLLIKTVELNITGMENTLEESQTKSKTKLDETGSKINNLLEKAKNNNTLTLLISAVYIFSAISILVSVFCLIIRFNSNYININPEPIYSLVLTSDSNISTDMSESNKISIVLINEQYVYGYIISENNNRKAIVINKDLIRQLTRD